MSLALMSAARPPEGVPDVPSEVGHTAAVPRRATR